MTSPRTETTDRSEQPEEKEKPQGGQLSATQVAAGALAAVSSAVVASFFGLAGTLIGAALASVISTVSAALYSSSLQKTNEKLRRARGQLTGRQPKVADDAGEAPPATRVLPAHLDPRRAPTPRRRPRWTRVAVYAAAVFVMAMGIVTGIELIGQKPVSALVGGTETSRTTTLGAITNASSSSEQESDPSTPSSPTTEAPATGSTAPATSTDEEGTSEDEESGSEETEPATPTTSSDAERTTDAEPTDSSDGSTGESSEDSSEDTPAPAGGAEPSS